MHEFDPRRPTARYAPRALLCVAAAMVLALVVRAGQSSAKAHASEAPSALILQTATFDPVDFRAGMALAIAMAKPRDPAVPFGPLRTRQTGDEAGPVTTVAQGRLSGSLYASVIQAGAPPDLTAQVVKLFAHKLDLSRDIHDGDSFRLVFNHPSDGRADDLLYAEIGDRDQVTRVYRYRPAGAAEPAFFDELGRNIRGFLLQTPVDGARVSSGFGERLHPILGYTRMHQGIDFAAPTGAPVYAAGDGVVEEARWAGGYGRWLKIRHDARWESGYGHLSGWTVRPGEHVRQGEVVAYVGSTGEATGPHLHYEVMIDGRKINPKAAKTPLGLVLGGPQLVAFKAQQAHVDALLEDAAPAPVVQLAQIEASAPSPSALHILLDGGGGGLRRSVR